jgi:uncharacterized protein (UPF0335 family)
MAEYCTNCQELSNKCETFKNKTIAIRGKNAELQARVEELEVENIKLQDAYEGAVYMSSSCGLSSKQTPRYIELRKRNKELEGALEVRESKFKLEHGNTRM